MNLIFNLTFPTVDSAMSELQHLGCGTLIFQDWPGLTWRLQ